MKVLSVLLLGILLIGNCYANTVWEKVSDTIVRKSETKIISDNTTLSDLRARKRQLEENKVNYDISIDAQIAELDKDIAEAVKLGIKEIDINGNIVQ